MNRYRRVVKDDLVWVIIHIMRNIRHVYEDVGVPGAVCAFPLDVISAQYLPADRSYIEAHQCSSHTDNVLTLVDLHIVNDI